MYLGPGINDWENARNILPEEYELSSIADTPHTMETEVEFSLRGPISEDRVKRDLISRFRGQIPWSVEVINI